MKMILYRIFVVFVFEWSYCEKVSFIVFMSAIVVEASEEKSITQGKEETFNICSKGGLKIKAEDPWVYFVNRLDREVPFCYSSDEPGLEFETTQFLAAGSTTKGRLSLLGDFMCLNFQASFSRYVTKKADGSYVFYIGQSSEVVDGKKLSMLSTLHIRSYREFPCSYGAQVYEIRPSFSD